MILLVSSTKDPASLNIRKQVLEHYRFEKTSEVFEGTPVYHAEFNEAQVKLVTLREETVKAQYLPERFDDLDLVVFISRHSSKSGTPTLSVHTPGNLGFAELGGLPRKVSISAAAAMHDALKALMRYKLEMRLEYDVSYECTHHGPSLDVPAMFVELGSSRVQWCDMKAAEVVAHAAVDAISQHGSPISTAVLGIGGTHYNRRFTEMALEDEVLFGHIIPKYALTYIDSEILHQCVKKTLEKVTCAVLDWKGIRSENKPILLASLKHISLPWKKI